MARLATIPAITNPSGARFGRMNNAAPLSTPVSHARRALDASSARTSAAAHIPAAGTSDIGCTT